jgi:tetratricopeptide (TPR) repeat protein
MNDSRKANRRRRIEERPSRKRILATAIVATTTLAIVLVAWWFSHRPQPVRLGRILAAYAERGSVGGLAIHYPLDGTLFPPEIVAPTFLWEDSHRECNLWLVAIDFLDGSEPMSFSCSGPQWTPSADDWESIKQRSLENRALVTAVGIDRERGEEPLSDASVSISTSRDEVGAPIFYREVVLPFKEAVLNPAECVRWRFGPISSAEQPSVVLDNLPVCGNCHSFSADGKTLAMEIDSGNDKASYMVAPVEPEITVGADKLITWSDYRREDGQRTFGLLCQISPDGKYLAGTVKDRALAVAKPELTFSQLFFMVKGYLAIYDRQKREYHALPGADDPQFVQTNPVWSPDGKYIVFARSRDRALDPPELRQIQSVVVPAHAADEFLSKGKTFLYDLYRIPFNGGKGGLAVPVPGASNNGMSNYFPKFSPDGKWIVFCRAKSFMLLQPDSELYIIPAQGGEARKLGCNTPRMNSWHSWSPNGKWLVFSSKAHSRYTQLFLTHIDEAGNSTPAVLLRQFSSPDRAANIPEFVNAPGNAIARIREGFLGEQSYIQIGGGHAFYGDYERAIRSFQKAISLNPNSAAAYENWGAALAQQNKLNEARARLSRALELQPDRNNAHVQLGSVLARLGMVPDALQHYREAVRLAPTDASAHFYLGSQLVDAGDLGEGEQQLAEAVRLDPKNVEAHVRLGTAALRAGKADRAATWFRRALAIDPDCASALAQLALLLAENKASASDRSSRQEAVTLATRACAATQRQDPSALLVLATACEQSGQNAEAISAAEEAMRLALDARNGRLVSAIRERIARLKAQGGKTGS